MPDSSWHLLGLQVQLDFSKGKSGDLSCYRGDLWEVVVCEAWQECRHQAVLTEHQYLPCNTKIFWFFLLHLEGHLLSLVLGFFLFHTSPNYRYFHGLNCLSLWVILYIHAFNYHLLVTSLMNFRTAFSKFFKNKSHRAPKFNVSSY